MLTFSLSAEWLKTKRTFFRMSLYSAPVLFNLLIFGYIILTKQRLSASRFYFNYFSILNFLLPFTVCFILTLLNDSERLAGHFKNIFYLNHHYYFLMFQKFIFSYLVITVAYLFNALFTLLLLKLPVNMASTSLYAYFNYGFILTWIAFLTSFIMFFFLSTICSFITTFLIGLTASLLTAIIGLTNLGAHIWVFFPFTWGSRFITMAISNNTLIKFFSNHIHLSCMMLLSPLVVFVIAIFFSVSLSRK